jgi:membrane associated rhomboid family serine protease
MRFSAIQILLGTLVAIYVLLALTMNTYPGRVAYGLMVLDPDRVLHHFELWRLLTYALVHDLSSPMHLLFNGMVLYFMGPELEYRWGKPRFLGYVFATALGGGIFVCASYLLNLSHASVIGFSGVCAGLVVAWGMMFPYRMVYLFGVIPLTGRQMLVATVAIELLYAMSGSNISSAAHFGGMAAGALLGTGMVGPGAIRQLKWRLKTHWR